MPNEKNCASFAIFVGQDRAARHFDHRANEIFDLDALFLHHVGGHALDDHFLIAQLAHIADERNHDLRNDFEPFLIQLAGRFHDRARLHLGDFGIRDAEPHAAMAEHRVEFVELLDARQQLLLLLELLALLPLHLHDRDLDHQVLALRQELVQRRIDGADRHRCAMHALEDPVEIVALHRQQLVECRAAVLFVVGENHALHDRDAALAEKHVLGAAQTDAAGAERVGELRLIGLIGIGAHAKAAELVGPLQQRVEALIDRRRPTASSSRPRPGGSHSAATKP